MQSRCSILILRCLRIILMLNFLVVSAQIEQPRSVRIEQDSSVTNLEKNKADTPLLNSSKEENPGKLVDVSIKKPRTVKMLPDHEYRHRGKEIEKKMNKKLETSLGTKGTQFLGDVKTSSGSVRIVFRDDGSQIDGDRVSIYHNDVLIYDNITLSAAYKSFQLHLEDGINKINIVALNEGFVSPNTAEFHVVDDQGKIISSNHWALYQGGMGAIMVIK